MMAELGSAPVDLSTIQAKLADHDAKLNTMLGTTIPQAQAQLATIPALASIAPPAVSATASLVGSGSAAARADHTHSSSVQRQRVLVALTGGVGSIMFPNAYSVIPAVNVDVETASNATALNLCSIVQGSISTTGFQVMVNKIPLSITVALGNLNLITPQTGSVYLSYLAGIPTA